MNKLMALIVATSLLPAMLFADLVSTAYVVPEGTAGNTPSAPYAMWSTAANDIRVAAESVVTHGIVNVLNGSYPATTGIMTSGSYEMRILATEQGDVAGTATLGYNYLFNDPVAVSGPDGHLIRVTKGKVTLAESSVFVDRGSDTKGLKTNYKLIFTGSDASFEKSGGYLYAGYDMHGTSVTFENGASCTCARLYLGQHANGKSASFTVQNGATASFTGVCQCGSEAADCLIVVSNAVVTANNYVFGKSSAEKGMKVVLAGEAPRVTSTSSAVFNGDTKVYFDVTEMPITGYANYVLYNSEITFEEMSEIHVTGAEALRARLRQAGVMSLSSNIGISFGGGTKMTLPASIVEATNERLAGTGFSLVVSGAYIKLNFVEPGGFQTPVYVDVNNTAAKSPYDSWSSASVSIGDAVFFLSKGGEVKLASGDYSAGYVAPEFAATYRAFKSSSDASAGTVTIGSTLFSGLAGTNVDPQRHLLTLAYGTFLVPDGNNVFLDSSSAGYAQNSSNRLVVTGADTVFNDKSHNLYVGYAARNTQLVIRDYATCYASIVYSGRSANGSGSTIIIEDGGLLDVDKQLTMGRESAAARLVVDNATLLSASLDCGADGTTNNERVCIKGEKPYLNPKNIISIGGNATLEFDVSELPLGKVDDHEARINTKDFKMTDAASFRIVGIDQLKSRLESDKSSPRKVKYGLIYAWGDFDLSDEKLNAARVAADLPDGWALEKESRYLYLTIKKNLGLAIILR